MAVSATANFDWRNPDYPAVFSERLAILRKIRANPDVFLPALRRHYRENPWQFITDWGCTADPRNVEIGLPSTIPFVLFPRQVEWCQWVVESWHERRPGVTPKSRELGVSWLAIALSCTLCLFNDGVTIGFGSRKLELVDSLGDPKSLFWKAREFLSLLPPEFLNGWTRKHAPENRIMFPGTGSGMFGEGGDDIGRGARSSIYIVDEAAHLARPDLAESSLSSTTNCRIDVGTANGIGNPFHRKTTTWPPERVFRFHWRDDPRKDDAWYADQKTKLDEVVVAQEIDIDFSASVTGVLIPSAWVQSAVDAHLVLGVTPSGARRGALDVADEGKDSLAGVIGHGILIEHLDEWKGAGSDIFASVQRMFRLCDQFGALEFKYDADGLGAGVRGDARVVNEMRTTAGQPLLTVESFRGSEGVFLPDAEDVKGRKNVDYFMNRKAQAWFNLARRFRTTFRAVTLGHDFNPDEIISLSSTLPHLTKLMAELSQPTASQNTIGKMVIDKTPDGTTSPNLADGVMIYFGVSTKGPMIISDDVLAEAARR